MHLSKKDIEGTERIKRLNIINSVTGIKPANLIGTLSNDGFPNVAIFSSLIHLGSDPALLGFVLRPQHEVPKDTYLNILATGFYTINHVHLNHVKQAHFTSAKFKKEESEFEKCCFTEEYLSDFKAPFVAESQLKIGMRFEEEIPIPINQTILMVGSIEHLILPDLCIEEDGHLNLTVMETAGIGGLNSYYELKKTAQFPYARASELPDFSD